MLLGLPEAEHPGGSVWQGAALLTVPFKSTPPLTQFLPLSSASKRFSLWGHSTSVLFQSLKCRTGTSGPDCTHGSWTEGYPWIREVLSKLWRLIVAVLNIHISRLNTIQHVVLAILTSELDSISESSQDNQTGKRKLSLFTEGTILYTKKY